MLPLGTALYSACVPSPITTMCFYGALASAG